MNICVFDTETTNIEKPFCYNIGYVIVDTDSAEVILAKDFVVEQVWHNPMLFSTAYYADKRPIYVSSMKGKKTVLDKFGYICQEMKRDFKAYGIEYAYAYNSAFDEKVFEFNCDWFKCINPFDTVKVFDIRAYAINHLANDPAYVSFCEANKFFTEAYNYSTTAEVMYRYITGIVNFDEEHTALADALIEWSILFETIVKGANIFIAENAPNSIIRTIPRTLTITDTTGCVDTYNFTQIRISKDKSKITLK